MTDEVQAHAKEASKDGGCGCSCGGSHADHETAREILDRRYASGQITKDQYEEMKQDLGSTQASAKHKSACY